MIDLNLKEPRLIYETKYWRVVLSENQDYLGRCVIILKRSCKNLSSLKKEEWKDFIKLVKLLESGLKKAFDATMFNWSCLMNDAYKSKTPNPSVHWHFRPRYNHEVKLANTTFKDPEFAHHYARERSILVSEKIRKIIISKIKDNLEIK